MNDPAIETSDLPLVERQGQPLSPAEAVELDDCWNRIGIAGDRACPELRTFVVCSRCPVYSKAGAQFLDRALSQEYRHEQNHRYGQPLKPAPGAMTVAIVFRVESEWLALPLRVFQEVAEPQTIRSLPRRRSGIVLGLANVRGQLLICISLARWLGLPGNLRSTEGPSPQRLLLASHDGSRFIFAVDEIQGVHRIPPQELREPPATSARSGRSCAQSLFLWRKQAVGLLNPDRMFADLNRSLM